MKITAKIAPCCECSERVQLKVDDGTEVGRWYREFLLPHDTAIKFVSELARLYALDAAQKENEK